MDSIFDDYRKIRASEQHTEISYRLLEILGSVSDAHRKAGGLRFRMRSLDIPVENRSFIVDEAKAIRRSLTALLAALDDVEGMCATPDPTLLLEAAE
ncbi:hypothetical protein [Ancylobacter oerskovii]|uniref:Uncharacterized protein n=1 Tax=Ancylobacter oerskovii TaxID=459519 RepID=A0ABW4Z2A4_9HYPH|nr:hypothetical protein [Ancylobacter oerskovii]MBS7545091.1 hypothetical protein [Ancylobacter oerskovii]